MEYLYNLKEDYWIKLKTSWQKEKLFMYLYFESLRKCTQENVRNPVIEIAFICCNIFFKPPARIKKDATFIFYFVLKNKKQTWMLQITHLFFADVVRCTWLFTPFTFDQHGTWRSGVYRMIRNCDKITWGRIAHLCFQLSLKKSF